ncbi:hypothetical protein B9Z55_019155 [Caenorhabditis nigoni]|uniref:Uncharacterized protein n=1 Tax=Caenorhabditis nigoni TaxID=1611254 RepID=A0A2G5TH90_9PELO|nr:hypothetical protein B9Z55_019155 [Caenorhabditis nigoni]
MSDQHKRVHPKDADESRSPRNGKCAKDDVAFDLERLILENRSFNDERDNIYEKIAEYIKGTDVVSVSVEEYINLHAPYLSQEIHRGIGANVWATEFAKAKLGEVYPDWDVPRGNDPRLPKPSWEMTKEEEEKILGPIDEYDLITDASLMNEDIPEAPVDPNIPTTSVPRRPTMFLSVKDVDRQRDRRREWEDDVGEDGLQKLVIRETDETGSNSRNVPKKKRRVP